MRDHLDNPPWTQEEIARGRLVAAEKRRGRPHLEQTKQPITIRLDHDVLEWLRGQGDGYQTRLNQILREYMLKHG